jgi:Hint domain
MALRIALDADQRLGEAGCIDGTGTLTLGGSTEVAGFDALIQGFTLGDQILLSGVTGFSDSLDVTGKTLTVFSNGTSIGAMDFSTAVTPLELAQVQCFAAGTLIETVEGPVAVEALAVGDEVVTLLGGCGRIVWVGSRTVDCARHPRPETVWPVRIAAGAFGENVPARDLFVSPDHAIYFDGVLIPAKYLIYGTTIRQEPRRHVVYHHIELPGHDVVLANGLPAESYLDTGDRSKFANGGGPIAMHPDFSTRMWDAMGCAPLVVTGPALASVRARLAGRAVQLAVDETDRQRVATTGSHAA